MPNCEFKTAGGNNRELYIIPRCQITGFTDNYTDNIIDDITLDGAASWFRVVARKDTVQGNAAYEPTNEVLNQQVIFTISKLGDGLTKEAAAQTALDFVEEIVNSAENFAVIEIDRSGVAHLYGFTNGLEREDIQYASGAAAADLSGTTITLTGPGEGLPRVVSSTYVATL